MELQESDNTQEAAVREAEEILQQHAILPENGRYTADQLARELARRGWRWRVEEGKAEAEKAFTGTGAVSRILDPNHADRVVALMLLLAGAIGIDEEHGWELMRPVPADIVVRAPDHRVVALAEVKGGTGYSEELAAELHRRLVSHSRDFARAPFFLLITPDKGFLWDQRSGAYPWTNATRSFALDPVVSRYLRLLRPDERPGESALIFAAAQWLSDVARRDPRRPLEVEQTLAETEFLEAIRDASVETEVLV